MHRIDHPTAVVNMHGPGKPGFGPGDPVNKIPATRFTPAWVNDVQENICRVIEAADIELEKGNGDQLALAITTMIAAAGAGYLRYNVGATLEAGYWTAPAALEIEGGVVTPDLAAGNVFVLSGPLTSNLTLAMPDEGQLVGRAGMMLVILAQDATGGRTLTLAPGYHLAGGSWSSAPNAVNLLWVTSDGGGASLDVVIAQRGA